MKLDRTDTPLVQPPNQGLSNGSGHPLASPLEISGDPPDVAEPCGRVRGSRKASGDRSRATRGQATMGTNIIDHKDSNIVTEPLLKRLTSGKLPRIVGRVYAHLRVHQAG